MNTNSFIWPELLLHQLYYYKKWNETDKWLFLNLHLRLISGPFIFISDIKKLFLDFQQEKQNNSFKNYGKVTIMR